MFYLVPSLLLFPVLVAKLVVVVVLFKFWRRAFWWFFLGGTVFYLAGFCLQAATLSLESLSFTPAVPVLVTRIDGRGMWAGTLGAFLFTCGFALCAAHLYQMRRRVGELEMIVAALSERRGEPSVDRGGEGR